METLGEYFQNRDSFANMKKILSFCKLGFPKSIYLESIDSYFVSAIDTENCTIIFIHESNWYV